VRAGGINSDEQRREIETRGVFTLKNIHAQEEAAAAQRRRTLFVKRKGSICALCFHPKSARARKRSESVLLFEAH